MVVLMLIVCSEQLTLILKTNPFKTLDTANIRILLNF